MPNNCQKRIAFLIVLPNILIKGLLVSKTLTCKIFSCINKNGPFIKETDIFGHIIGSTVYTSHIDHITSQLIAFEQSASCLSVFFE